MSQSFWWILKKINVFSKSFISWALIDIREKTGLTFQKKFRLTSGRNYFKNFHILVTRTSYCSRK